MGPQDPNLGPPGGPKRGVPGGPKSGFSGVLGGSWGDPPRPPENAEKMALFWGLRCENEGGWGGSAHYPDPTAQSAERLGRPRRRQRTRPSDVARGPRWPGSRPASRASVGQGRQVACGARFARKLMVARLRWLAAAGGWLAGWHAVGALRRASDKPPINSTCGARCAARNPEEKSCLRQQVGSGGLGTQDASTHCHRCASTSLRAYSSHRCQCCAPPGLPRGSLASLVGSGSQAILQPTLASAISDTNPEKWPKWQFRPVSRWDP